MHRKDIATTLPAYPAAHKLDQVDNYHDVKVPDPFRWLEDDTSLERAAWIAAQNAATTEYLSHFPVRDELRRRFDQLLRYPRYYDLMRRGPHLFFKKNDGLQNQLVLYVQQDLECTPEVLIDPNELSQDGTVRLTRVVLSKDGKYIAYGLSFGGVDWEEYCIKNMNTRQDLSDRLRWVKCSHIAWRDDGFYYSRYQAPSDPTMALSARNENHQVWYHQVDSLQSVDTLVYEDLEHPLRFHFVRTSDDERVTVLSVFDFGAGHAGNALWLLDHEGGKRHFVPLVTSFDDEFGLVDNEEDKLLVLTNRRAPNRRVVMIDPANPGESQWTEIIQEKGEPLDGITAAGGKLFALYRKDAAHRAYVFDRTGRLEHEIPLPGIGLAQIFQGQRQDADAFWSYTSFTAPTTIYRYDIARRTSSIFKKPELQFDPADYETKQIFYPSKDGTRIPMFVVYRKNLRLNGKAPSLLEGYGGNGISVGPAFDPFLIALLERGVLYAAACLRGGGEYGETWHRAGWRDTKQNVFDDCIAAAEWLHANGYTSSDRSALMGASNGGLLVGAVMTQRPDLFKVAMPIAGVMDMLRFQHFTLGWTWTAEYGSSDEPAMFPILLAYSPLHNIRRGVSYPATLVTTSEHDDRVVPAHSFKFVAALQDMGAAPNPYLIRIGTNSGHSPVSLPKALDERADLYAFMLAHMPGATEAASAG
jgi:prolyl oligopeptidase